MATVLWRSQALSSAPVAYPEIGFGLLRDGVKKVLIVRILSYFAGGNEVMFVTDCNPGVVAVDQHPAFTQQTTVAIRPVNLSGARGLTLLQIALELDFPITDPIDLSAERFRLSLGAGRGD